MNNIFYCGYVSFCDGSLLLKTQGDAGNKDRRFNPAGIGAANVNVDLAIRRIRDILQNHTKFKRKNYQI